MKKHYHLIGINGIGLSGVARILLEMGNKVTGSDLKLSLLTENLTRMGAHIYNQHKEENINGADYVVVSSAIKYDNPEVKAAQKKGIPILHRAQVLGQIMENRIGIAISGTHGKTTTTSILSHLMEESNLDPTIAVGGQLKGIMSNAKLGKSSYMVVEADESDASFLYMEPRWIIVTSVDVDVNLNVAPYSHLNFNYQKTLDKVRDAFYQFIDKLPDDGMAIMCIDDNNVRNMLPNIKKKFITYGISSDAQIRAENIKYKNFGSSFDLYCKGEFLGNMKLKVPGLHNVQNSLSVIAVALELGLSFKEISSKLLSFGGVKRRFELVGHIKDIMVYDDYAHNPRKVQALLKGACTGGRNRVISVFQPHRYTRTKFLFEEFSNSFSNADVLVLTEIYSAGEDPIVGIRGESLAEAIKNSSNAPKEVYFIPHKEEIINFLKSFCKAGDIVITCGAGDINKLGGVLMEALREELSTSLLNAG